MFFEISINLSFLPIFFLGFAQLFQVLRIFSVSFFKCHSDQFHSSLAVWVKKFFFPIVYRTQGVAEIPSSLMVESWMKDGFHNFLPFEQ